MFKRNLRNCVIWTDINEYMTKSEYLETATKSYKEQLHTHRQYGLICIPACVQIVNCDIIAGD